MKTQNFTLNGKLGDFMHMLFGIKHICKKNNTKANIYLYHYGWEHGFDKAYSELYDIVMSQSYVNSFNKLENYKMLSENSSGPIEVFDQKLLDEGYTHMEDFMRSPNLYHNCWSEIFSLMFDFPLEQPYKWLEFDKVDPRFSDKVIINRRFNPSRLNPEFPYEDILQAYRGNVIFIASDINDYNKFPQKDLCDFYQISTIDEWCTIINSSGLYIGNLSGPTSVASALDKVRLVELPQTVDIHHWIGEEKYSKNIGWYVSKDLTNVNLI